MKGRSLRLATALGAGTVLLGLAALLVRVSELTDFFAVCFWLGAITIGLAMSLSTHSPSRRAVPRGGRAETRAFMRATAPR